MCFEVFAGVERRTRANGRLCHAGVWRRCSGFDADVQTSCADVTCSRDERYRKGKT